MKTKAIILLMLQISLPALWADEAKPVKPVPKDKCPVCGMFVAKYPDWVAAVAFKDGTLTFFDGVKDMMKYYFSMAKYAPGKTAADIRAIHVTDYYRLELVDAAGQVRDQVAALSNIYSHKAHEISCEIHDQKIFLPVDQAIPCALVMNEILSNAYKHAFKGRKHGSIDIFAVQENGQIIITVRDDGIGIPDDFDISRTTSLGMKLIRTLVQHQLKGSLMVKNKNGTQIIIESSSYRFGDIRYVKNTRGR